MMGLTYCQALALGIGDLHPDAPGNRDVAIRVDRARSVREDPAIDPSPPPPPSAAPRDKLTKLERRFRDEILEPAWRSARIADYWREPIKLRIAGRTFYTPDFLVIALMSGGFHLTFIECKGFMRDDAAVKLKTAAIMYPCFTWLLATRPARGWEFRLVGPIGIARNLAHVPWI